MTCIFARNRFGIVTDEEIFKIDAAVHINRTLITATKIPISFKAYNTSFLDASKSKKETVHQSLAAGTAHTDSSP